MKLGEMFPSKWLHPEDLSKAVTVRLSAITAEQVYNQRTRQNEQVYAMHFETVSGKKLEKMLVLNITRGRQLADITGSDDSDTWVGQVIRLVPGEMSKRATIFIDPAPKPPAQPGRTEEKQFEAI